MIDNLRLTTAVILAAGKQKGGSQTAPAIQ
jgi:hypothetical protein